jgi:hypothetical protein
VSFGVHLSLSKLLRLDYNLSLTEYLLCVYYVRAEYFPAASSQPT